jgi:hypothetical protein
MNLCAALQTQNKTTIKTKDERRDTSLTLKMDSTEDTVNVSGVFAEDLEDLLTPESPGLRLDMTNRLVYPTIVL